MSGFINRFVFEGHQLEYGNWPVSLTLSTQLIEERLTMTTPTETSREWLQTRKLHGWASDGLSGTGGSMGGGGCTGGCLCGCAGCSRMGACIGGLLGSCCGWGTLETEFQSGDSLRQTCCYFFGNGLIHSVLAVHETSLLHMFDTEIAIVFSQIPAFDHF